MLLLAGFERAFGFFRLLPSLTAPEQLAFFIVFPSENTLFTLLCLIPQSSRFAYGGRLTFTVRLMKSFKLAAHEIVVLAPGHGGCLATDRITVDGAPVGYCYREAPSKKMDSGWRFFAGDESDEYMGINSNHGVYDINTVANYDQAIIPVLDAPQGAAFERIDNKLIPVEGA